MKTLLPIAIICLLSSIGISQDYNLIVTNGHGSGSYAYGDTVHIFSDKANALRVFEKWSGSGESYLTNANEWHTTLLVRAQSDVTELELYADYGDLSLDITLGVEMVSLFGMNDGEFMEDVEKEVFFVMPEDPKGIVFLFHGTGGNGSSMYTKYEPYTLAKDLYHAGYGTISTDANERTVGDQNGDDDIRWLASAAWLQSTENNIDLYNIQALRDTFVARHELGDGFPFFAYGISNGANFADLASAVLGFQASAHNTAHGSPSLYGLRPDANPVIWIQSLNDQHPNADPVVARSNHQALLDRGICSEWQWLEKSPLYEKRFTRSRNNISVAKSTEIYQQLLDVPDLVDEDHFIKVDNILEEIPIGFFAPLNLTLAQIKDVKSQLKVANADHGGNGDFNKTIIHFFDNLCSTTAVTDPSTTTTQLNVKISPNPTSGIVTVQSSSPILSAALINSSGQLQKKLSNTSFSQSIEIDLSTLNSGIYYLNILTINGQQFKKIVVE